MRGLTILVIVMGLLIIVAIGFVAYGFMRAWPT